MKKSVPRRGQRFSRELAVLYDDPSLLVINKPPGLAAVPVEGSSMPNALSLVGAALRPVRQSAHVVHRIDRFASGILVFAKTQRDRDALVRQFLAHTPVRDYLAVVRGHLKEKEGTLVHYFRRVGMHEKPAQEGDPKAARAELRYTVTRQLRGASLVRVALVTGLQNQIRVQFSALGHPVVGDRKYHPKEAEETRIARVALHAVHLEFRHPRSGETVAVDCPPPSDFRSLVEALAPRS